MEYERIITIGVCQIKVQQGEFRGKDYHVYYLGRFYITCPSMKMAKAFVGDLNEDYERMDA